MAPRLADLAAFVAAVEAGGFSAAAERLNLSRSAVGKRVAQLEDRIGVRLLHRTTRSISLTEDGAVFYERCAQAMADLRAAEAAAQGGRAEPVGRVRLSVPVLFGRHCVAPILAELARDHNGLEIEASFTDRPVNMIEEGYDLVVRNGGLPPRAPLMSRVIMRQNMGVYGSPPYLRDRGVPLTLADLTAHDAVVYSRTGRSRAWLFPRRPMHRSRSKCVAACDSTIWRRWRTQPAPIWVWRGCPVGWRAIEWRAVSSCACWPTHPA